jgi:uncharacterized cupredoxin-like copper-binding protein
MKHLHVFPIAALLGSAFLFTLTGCDANKPAGNESHEGHDHGSESSGDDAAMPNSHAGAGDHHAGSGDHHAATPDTKQPSDARKITVVATDFAFDPATVTAKPGEKLFIELVNQGNAVHMWQLEGKPETHVHTAVGETSAKVVIAPQKVGTYKLVCTTPGHTELGMVGSLKVE